MSRPLTADKQARRADRLRDQFRPDGLGPIRSGIRIYPVVCGASDGSYPECPVLGAVAAGCVGWFRRCSARATKSREVVPRINQLPLSRQRVERLHLASYRRAVCRCKLSQSLRCEGRGGPAFICDGLCCPHLCFLKTGIIWYPINLLARGLYTQS